MTSATIIYEPKHWNQNCGCMIPAAWTAFIEHDEESLPKWPCGDTYEEAVENVQREYPGCKIF